MSNIAGVIGYNGITDKENYFSDETKPRTFHIVAINKVKGTKPKSREGTAVMTKEKRIANVYSQIILGMVIFALFALFSVVTGKVMDRLGASLLLVLSISGILAFYNDKKRWRKRSET